MSISEEELKQKIVFVPCKTKKDLHRWIKSYLKVDLPDCIVDSDSNSSPMDMVWEVYSKALDNNDPNYSRVLAMGARSAFKTLSASILEVLFLVHLQRNVAHMAAIESQASKSQSYVKKFFNQPYLRKFVIGDNKRRTDILRYHDEETGENLSQDEWLKLSELEKAKYVEIRNYINIVVCTVAGANSEHVPFMCVDEVDVVPNLAAYEEAKMIPDSTDGHMPITLLTSSRKYSFGLVQKEIDEAAKTGIHVRHWNIIDVTKACPAERHRPDLEKIVIYRNDKTLQSIPEEEFNKLQPAEADGYIRDVGYSGCLSNCKLFAMCKGKLATKQTSNSSLLKPIDHTINQFKVNSPEVALAQLLCKKPSSEGLIYPTFNREIHMITANQIREMMTGEKVPVELTKEDLIKFLKTKEVQFAVGMDWGFSHCFAMVVAAIYGHIAYIIDAYEIPELELSQKLELCEQKIKHLDPIIFPDPAYPADIKTFKRHGFRMKDWDKYKGSVVAGIESVRMKLQPALGSPELFLLKGDPGCELLAKRLSGYHWKLDAEGNPTDIPDDKDDDQLDSIRYVIMNVFAPKGKFIAPRGYVKPNEKENNHQNWLKNKIEELTGETVDDSMGVDDPTASKGRKGKFFYDV